MIKTRSLCLSVFVAKNFKQMKFIKQAFSNINTVGAIAPSSPNLSSKMTKPINFDNQKTIIELGAGTGAITRVLLKKMNKDSKLFSFENNEAFAKGLEKIKDDKFQLINDNALKLKELMHSYNIEEVDYVVSGLPLAIFKQEFTEKLISEIYSVLKVKGKFIQFQYSTVSKKQLKHFFKKVAIDFTIFNIPPAFIYICEK